MPELPDVEVFKRYLDATALHQPIDQVTVRDERVLGRVSSRTLRHRLSGREFQSTRRHGKYLFAELTGSGWLALHFGMTGFLKYFKNEEPDPEHDMLLVRFSNGYGLGYNNRRRLGTVDFTPHTEDFIARHSLGPDALAMDRETLDALLRAHRGTIKPLLMDQSALAGLGNVYTDEILFQAAIHPRTPVPRLDAGARRRLYRSMTQVLTTTIERGADPARFPRTYLTPHRRAGASCPRCGAPLKQIRISGRATYYCPRRQPAP
ncbi:MAG TPA: DNA-formamidopyrimidine glycosylase family protein [Gammaproteobacteria bacterium]|nr:DNA-formamidopyrimidine glycosylase family protein [Gammaproteobacteria bacterium]